MPKSNSCRRTKLPTEHIALMNVFIILRESRNKRACLVEVDCSHIYHWIVPIYTLQHEGGMGAVDCNNQVKTAANYFSNACAVHSLINKYNPIDDNSNKRDASEDYYEHTGAFRCLVEGGGHVGLMKHTTVKQSTGDKRKELHTRRVTRLQKNAIWVK